MKSNSKFALSAVAGLGVAAFAAVPAMAADVVYEEPPAPQPIFESAPVSTWAGPYAGLHLGYGFSGRAEVDGAGGTNRIGTDGWIGGAFGGYNFQNGQFVYGLEGDINYTGIEGSNAGESARSRFDGSIRARAGVAVNDDILVYGTAGGAAESLRVRSGGASDTNTMLGYTVGGGVDARLTEQVFARGEYRYTDYGSETFALPGVGSVDSSNHRVTVGVGFKFLVKPAMKKARSDAGLLSFCIQPRGSSAASCGKRSSKRFAQRASLARPRRQFASENRRSR